MQGGWREVKTEKRECRGKGVPERARRGGGGPAMKASPLPGLWRWTEMEAGTKKPKCVGRREGRRTT